MTDPRKGTPGTMDQLRTLEGPAATPLAGNMPTDDPAGERIAAVEGDNAMASREDRIRTRAHELWEQNGKQFGMESDHWYQAEREIDAEADSPAGLQAKSGAAPALAAHSKDAHEANSPPSKSESEA